MSNENKTMTLSEQFESIPPTEQEPSNSLGPPVPAPSTALLARYPGETRTVEPTAAAVFPRAQSILPLPLGEGQGEGSTPPSPQLSLDRYPGETPRAFAAFTAFFTLGHQRSLQAVADKLALSIDTIKKWSSRHDWQSRVAKLDGTVHQAQADLHVAAEKQAAADWLHRLETFREQEWDAAQKLLSAARCYLEAFGDEDLSRMTLAQVSRALRISSQIGRLALAGAEPPVEQESTASPIQQQLLDSLARLSAHNDVRPQPSTLNSQPFRDPQPSTVS